MYSTVYVEQYPTAGLNKYVDYLLYKEQLKKEQEAFYYYRLRQQQHQAYLQEIQRRQEEEKQRQMILAYYQMQQQEKLRQQQLQQERLRQQRMCQQQLEQQRQGLFTAPAYFFGLQQQQQQQQHHHQQQQQKEDDERVAQVVEFLFGPESSNDISDAATSANEASSSRQVYSEQPQREVLSLDKFLQYIAMKSQELENDEEKLNEASASNPVLTPTKEQVPEPAKEEVVEAAVESTVQPVTEEPVTEEPVTEAPATEESVTEVPVTEVPVTEVPVTEVPATEEPVTEEPVTEESVTEEFVTEPAANPIAEEAVFVKQPANASNTIQVEDKVYTMDEFVDYIADKSRELFEEHQENFGLDEEEAAEEEKKDKKEQKLKLIQEIKQKLEAIRQENEQHILNTQLDFSASDDDSVSATTTENKEFLGYENEIMKVLLKLDAIDSDGDEEIRAERKNLVKFAESMLNRLDEFKQKEWERASNASHSEVEEDFLFV